MVSKKIHQLQREEIEPQGQKREEIEEYMGTFSVSN